MEESELEEGEACSYNTLNDFGGTIDPDNDLSYIVTPLHLLTHMTHSVNVALLSYLSVFDY